MNTADTTENTEKKTSALPAKKVSDSETHQLHVVIHPDINGFGRLFGGRLLEWIDEVAGATARRHCGRDATTVAIDNLYFKSGAYLNDIIVLIGKVTHVGHTSMEVRVDTYREEQTSHQPCLLCHGSHGRRRQAHSRSRPDLRERRGTHGVG